ncbi:MAG: hypothetical protein LBU62_03805 [Bacteroidales bacterium]|jgi:hypothetical protein|nr:hypothetical protein [Bacteroidales bacterium]
MILKPPDICQRSTFYGVFPFGQGENHLGIVLNVKGLDVFCCYCTSKLHETLLKYNRLDCFPLKKEEMEPYFKNPKPSYIYISDNHIIKVLYVTLVSQLSQNELESKEPFNADLFSELVAALERSPNLSERFKAQLMEVIRGNNAGKTIFAI